MKLSRENRDIAAALAVGGAVLAGAFLGGQAVGSHPANAAALPCHTAALMSACILDISQHNAVAIGSKASSVTTSCKQQAHGWACLTGFNYQGGRVCLVSYLVEGRVTGIPVFIRNVQEAPSACSGAA